MALMQVHGFTRSNIRELARKIEYSLGDVPGILIKRMGVPSKQQSPPLRYGMTTKWHGMRTKWGWNDNKLGLGRKRCGAMKRATSGLDASHM